MDSKFQALPPLKRLRLLQQQQEYDFNGSKANSYRLPAKKRKESRDVEATTTTTTTTYCLPAKKRIWAFQPDSDTGKPLLPFDLNVEFDKQVEMDEIKRNPISKSPQKCNFVAQNDILDENKKTPFENCPKKCIKTRLEEENKENEIQVVEKTKKTPLAKSPKRSILDAKKHIFEETKKTPLAKSPKRSILDAKKDIFEEIKKTQIEKSFQKCINVCHEARKAEAEEEEEEDGIICDICKSTDGDPKDPIVFCDGCDLMVHSTCYGNPLIKKIPEGDWFCNLCLASKSEETKNENKPLSCCLCPIKVGAMKPTTVDSKWAHLVCALLVPEVFFEDPEGRERIDCSKVPEKRWKGKCYVCKTRKGCVIECSEPKCGLDFHVTCGLNEDLSIEYREGKKGVVVAGFCKSHTELWKKQQQTGKFKIVARDEHMK